MQTSVHVDAPIARMMRLQMAREMRFRELQVVYTMLSNVILDADANGEGGWGHHLLAAANRMRDAASTAMGHIHTQFLAAEDICLQTYSV
jgi:hypothetical protein